MSMLEQIDFKYGPKDLFYKYISSVEHTVKDLGVRLRISHDFDRLVELNSQNKDNWPKILPCFNPEYSALSEHNAYFVEGINEDNETVVTTAGKLYIHTKNNLAFDLQSLQVMYDDPTPHTAAGETLIVTAPIAEHIYGSALFSAVVWVRPDYRRHGFTKILPRITRLYAMAKWNVPIFWMIITPELDKGGVTKAYGSWSIDGKLNVHMPSLRDDFEVLFATMGQDTLIRDIIKSLEPR